MPGFSPALIQTMRAVLDEVITKIPREQATPGIKAALAECIRRSAAAGQISYEGSARISLRANSVYSFDDDLKRGRGKCARDALSPILARATPCGRSPTGSSSITRTALAVKPEAEEDWGRDKIGYLPALDSPPHRLGPTSL
jgi:hypothetical protein